ncbi:MAG: hypothetical protein ACJAZM_002290 [Cyclobacteriaceae bacterium]|jgi:hypothetical protein
MAIRINPTNDLFGSDVSVVNTSGALAYTVNPTSTYTLTIPDGTFVNADGDAYSFTAEALVSGGADANKWEFTTIGGVYPSTAANTVTALSRMLACIDNEFIALQQNIFLNETSITDFGNGTVIFELSSGFEFNTAVGAASGVATLTYDNANTLRLTLASVNNGALENIQISGLQIKYTGTDVSATGTIKRTGGTADLYGMSDYHGTNLLDLEVELVSTFSIVTATPTDGQIFFENVSICKDDLFDLTYRTKTTTGDRRFNGVSDFSILADASKSAEDNGDNDVIIYNTSNPNAGTNVIQTTADVANDLTISYANLETSTTINRSNVGAQSVWVTQMNSRGCESSAVKVDLQVLDVPNAETIAGSDYDDQKKNAGTPTADYGSACGKEEIVLGALTNDAFTNYTFRWYGQDVAGTVAANSIGNENSSPSNPRFKVPFNKDITDVTGANTETTGFVAKKTVRYYVDISDANGCQAAVNTGFNDGSANRQAAIDVVVDREVRPDIFSQNGLTFTESVSTGQPIFGDLGPGGTGVNETTPKAADASLVIDFAGASDEDYPANPYTNRTFSTTDLRYSFSFTGNGLGNLNTTDTDNYHQTTFTPSAVGAANSPYTITYNLTENLSGCSASVSTSIEVLSVVSDVFISDDFTTYQTSKLITSVDDGDLSTTTTPIIRNLIPAPFTATYAFERYEGPGVFQDSLVLTLNANPFVVGNVITGETTLTGVVTQGTVVAVSGLTITLNKVVGSFNNGNTIQLKDTPGTNATIASQADKQVSLFFGSTLGAFQVGETVSATGMSGKVVDILNHSVGGALVLEDVTGTFTNGTSVTGGTSSVSQSITTVYPRFKFNLANAVTSTPATDFLTVNSDGTSTANVELVLLNGGVPFVYGNKEVVITPLPQVSFSNLATHYNDYAADNDSDPNNDSNTLDINLELTSSGATTPTNSNVKIKKFTLLVNAGVDNAGNSFTVTGTTNIAAFQLVKLIEDAGAGDANGLKSIYTTGTHTVASGNTAGSGMGLTANDLTNLRDEISYTLTVTTLDSDDPLYSDLNSFGSPRVIQKSFTLFKRLARPTLVLNSTDNKNVNRINQTVTTDTDYLVEYCQGETIPNVKVTAATSGQPTSIKWYYSATDERVTKGNQLAVPTASERDVPPFTLFQTNTPPAGKYVFRFTQSSNVGTTTSNGGSTTFDGTESDYSTLTVIIHDVPEKPRLDIAELATPSTKGEEQTVAGLYVFEYCEGEAVDNLNIFRGGFTQDFSADPTTTTSGWVLPATSVFANSRLEISAGQTVRSQYLDRVDSVSFTVASSDGTSVSAEVRYYPDQAITVNGTDDYEVLEVISTNSATAATKSYVIEKFNDFDVTGKNSAIRIVANSTQSVMHVDNFNGYSMINNKNVYDWFVYDGTNYILIDGFNLDGNVATLDVSDNAGQGRISSAGNTSPTATELFDAYYELLLSTPTYTKGNTPDDRVYDFYVSRREDINYANDVNFYGCSSAKTKVQINVYSVPGNPSGFTTDINAASGKAPSGNDVTYNTRIFPADEINTPELANAAYRWYYNNSAASQSGNQFSEVRPDNSNGWTGETFTSFTFSDVTNFTINSSPALSTSGHYAPASEFNNQIYLAQVTNLLNRKTNATTVSSYVGCETPAASRQQVDITIYQVDEIPVIGAYSAFQDSALVYFDTSSDEIGNYIEFDYEAKELNGDTLFYAQTFYTDAANAQVFRWYYSDASGTRSTSERVPNGQGVTNDPQDTVVSAADLLIGGITNNATRYFLVTQVTDIENGGQSSEFSGVESEGTLIRINIYNTPNAPAEASSTTSSSPGTLNFYYCEGETIEPFSVKSYDEDAASNIFYWYRSEAHALAQDSTTRLTTSDARGLLIQPAEMLNDNVSFPDDNLVITTPTDMSGSPVPGTYTFYVTQASNKKITPNNSLAGDPFYGNEGNPLELTIYVRNVPLAPAVLDQTELICETDATPTFSISGFDSKITYTWYDSLNNSQANGQNFTPNNYLDGNGDNTVGFFGYDATQTTDININNEGFEGCESPVTPLLLTVREIPTAPFSTGSSDIYTICEREDVLTLVIDNPDTKNTSLYTWFDQDNLELDQGLTFDPTFYIDQSSINAEVANDTRFRVKYTAYINDGENFDGCTSDFRDVIHRINGLPSLSFVDLTTDDAYCLEDINIPFSAQTEGITGSSRFSLFSDFSQVGTGLTDNGDNSAVLNLEALHLNDVDSRNPQPDDRRLVVGGNSTSRNVYFEFTDTKGCVNTDSVLNVVVDPFPAIDFKIDDEVTPDYVTCLNDSLDIRGERNFFLEGFYIESAASIAKQGQRSDFKIFNESGTELEVGILSDLDAFSEFSPQDARKSLSSTDKDIQDFSPQNYYTVTFTHTDVNGCTNVADNRITVNPRPQFALQQIGDASVIINNKACATETVEFDIDMANLPDEQTTFTWFIENDQITTEELLLPADDDVVRVFSQAYNIGGGPKQIVVIAQDDNTGCLNIESENKNIGVVPDVRFNWTNMTVGKKTAFEFQERNLDIRYSKTAESYLTITDENGIEVIRKDIAIGDDLNGDLQIDPAFDTLTFDIPGIYRARYFFLSDANCSAFDIVEFNILDKIIVPSTGILHTFDNGPEGWHTDSTSVDGFYQGLNDSILGIPLSDEQRASSIPRYSTWEWAVPAGRTINQANVAGLNVGGAAWVTNADGAYGNRLKADNPLAENSWVYSPTYDLSQMEKPAVSFNYVSDLVNTDGVVLQYSIDEGYTWNAVGEFDFDDGNSGVNWYNSIGLPGNPGNIDEPTNSLYNANQFGWSVRTDVPPGSPFGLDGLDQDYYWYFAANKIDAKNAEGSFLIPEDGWSDIRFRFSLGARPGFKERTISSSTGEETAPIEGFGFDNFRIYDRQKVVLFESFSSVLLDDSKEAEAIIFDRVSKAGDGAVWVNYFTDLDGQPSRPTDELFKRNDIDPGARGGYYGIADAPTSVLDGEVIEKKTNSDSRANELLGWNQFALNKKELVEPEFDISLVELPSNSEDELKLSGTFTSLIDLPANTELSFRFIVFENYITNQAFGNYTVSDTIRNVMRAILPDAGGYVEKRSVQIGDAFEFPIDWTINAIYNLDELRVVAFVQNEETREIYQVAVLDIDNKINTLTGVGDRIVRGVDFEMFPNPANSSFKVEFEQAVPLDTEWTLYDQMGRLMRTGTMKKNQYEVIIETDDFASGVYFLQLYDESFRWEPKKLIIMH